MYALPICITVWLLCWSLCLCASHTHIIPVDSRPRIEEQETSPETSATVPLQIILCELNTGDRKKRGNGGGTNAARDIKDNS